MKDLSIFYGPNAGYVLELYEHYQQDPTSVDAATRAFFDAWPSAELEQAAAALPSQPTEMRPASSIDVTHTVAAARLIRYIRELGHLEARIDPLGSKPPGDPGLRLDIHGVTESDLAALPASIVRGPLVDGSRNALEAVNKLRAVYTGSIGYETDHIQNYEERSWIRDAIESQRFFGGFDAERKRDLLDRLTEVETFERFLHQTFRGQRRFSIEGCDLLIPMLDSIIRNAATDGVQEVVLGMAHRGRLNVLAHILGKPYTTILQEFHSSTRDEGASASDKGSLGWTGDVKYHLGARRAYHDSGIKEMPITLAPNPSHLEFVDPVIVGRTRAAQEQRGERGAPKQDEKAALAIMMHGDAAFPGQGIVAETLNLSRLRGYRIGGTIHIITNNQIGFTTEPNDGRSTLYASDLAKGFEIPILHVNADDPEACIAAARMAYAYIERFHEDFLIDLVGYRRWGHNEGDEPAYTQPLMYAQIAKHPTVREILAHRLQEEGAITAQGAEQMVQKANERLLAAHRGPQHNGTSDGAESTQVFAPRTSIPSTAVTAERLQEFNNALLKWPQDFAPHPRLARLLERRRDALSEPHGIDWAHAEELAFASILDDAIPIRMTGQDAERGTFSQRHLVLHDVETGASYTPLQELPSAKASFAVYNSPLSENAVMGFEYGYSMHAPGVLVLWEGQFGDFANSAQVIIDQFIVSGNAKWGQRPALVLLLPHGYEGQGPDHSNARVERYLQLAAGDNLRVANCTTAAQYFHLLRRQAALLEHDPRPLIIMTPKSLLRHPQAASSLEDLTTGTFQPVLEDTSMEKDASQITRLILCSGKVYVDLITAGEVQKAAHIAVARLEELYPFPATELERVFGRYPNLQEVVWLQEEPRNMGAWNYVALRLRAILPDQTVLFYIGRPPFASPAEGTMRQHTAEQARIVQAAVSATSSHDETVDVLEEQLKMTGVQHAG